MRELRVSGGGGTFGVSLRSEGVSRFGLSARLAFLGSFRARSASEVLVTVLIH